MTTKKTTTKKSPVAKMVDEAATATATDKALAMSDLSGQVTPCEHKALALLKTQAVTAAKEEKQTITDTAALTVAFYDMIVEQQKRRSKGQYTRQMIVKRMYELLGVNNGTILPPLRTRIKRASYAATLGHAAFDGEKHDCAAFCTNLDDKGSVWAPDMVVHPRVEQRTIGSDGKPSTRMVDNTCEDMVMLTVRETESLHRKAFPGDGKGADSRTNTTQSATDIHGLITAKNVAEACDRLAKDVMSRTLSDEELGFIVQAGNVLDDIIAHNAAKTGTTETAAPVELAEVS